LKKKYAEITKFVKKVSCIVHERIRRINVLKFSKNILFYYEQQYLSTPFQFLKIIFQVYSAGRFSGTHFIICYVIIKYYVILPVEKFILFGGKEKWSLSFFSKKPYDDWVSF